MVFTDAIFFPFFFAVYFAFTMVRRVPWAQIVVLLAASYIFYGWWKPQFLLLILFSTALDFVLGQKIYDATEKTRKKLYLLLSMVGNLGLLAYFKYANFFIDSFSELLGAFSIHPNFQTLNIILPVGISFYTFQTMSYTIDIYRGELKPTRSLLKFMLFVVSFPQLVAGPIVRAREFLPQLSRNLATHATDDGIFYILYGVVKKVFIADIIGFYFVDPAFRSSGDCSSLMLLLASYCYCFQIFFDFSAYSDIAIGIGKLFGLRFPINFKSPFLAVNPSDFWRRWHISLSTWLRDYLYISLGGNRFSKFLTLRNLVLVMLLGGLWHGANWTFVVWGALHGLYLLVYRVAGRDHLLSKITPRWIAVFFFFNLTSFAFIFFRSESISSAWAYLTHMLTSSQSIEGNVQVLLLVLLGLTLIHNFVEPKLQQLASLSTKWPVPVLGAFLFAVIVLASYLGELGVAHQAFIYFQF